MKKSKAAPETVRDVLSARIVDALPYAKYTRWAAELPVDSLVVVMQAVGTFGQVFNETARERGMPPVAKFAPHGMEEHRMQGALRAFAALHAGLDCSYLPVPGLAAVPGPGPAFAPRFLVQFRPGGALSLWTRPLNEHQLCVLLWQAGEYGSRVVGPHPAGGEYPQPRFDVEPEPEQRMRDALRTVARITTPALFDAQVALA